MSEQELTEIENRANAATREPWIVGDAYYVPTASLSAVSVYGMGMEVAECQIDTDGAFIAAARADVPALVAEVRTLRAELDADPALHDAMIIAEGQRDQARAERDALRDQWSGLLIEQARLMALRDAAVQQRDDAIAERDALRKDAALLDALQAEHERFDPVAALVVKVKHDRNSSDWANVVGDVRAALNAALSALAVQP